MSVCVHWHWALVLQEFSVFKRPGKICDAQYLWVIASQNGTCLMNGNNSSQLSVWQPAWAIPDCHYVRFLWKKTNGCWSRLGKTEFEFSLRWVFWILRLSHVTRACIIDMLQSWHKACGLSSSAWREFIWMCLPEGNMIYPVHTDLGLRPTELNGQQKCTTSGNMFNERPQLLKPEEFLAPQYHPSCAGFKEICFLLPPPQGSYLYCYVCCDKSQWFQNVFNWWFPWPTELLAGVPQ